MNDDDLHRLAEIARSQGGAITGRQAGRQGRQLLDRVGVRTYRSPFFVSSELADLHALVLDCGADTFVSGPTAAALHGFDGFRLRRPFHVTILRGRNVQRAHHHVHTTTDLPQIDRSTVVGLPAMAPTRTLIDLSRFVSASALTAALDSALRAG